MKNLLIMIMSIFTLTMNAQENNIGYISLVGKYDHSTNKYNENNLSGITIVMSQLYYHSGDLTTIRLEFIDKGISLVNEYILMEKIVNSDSLDYNVYFLQDVYKDELIIKYTDREFEIWSDKIQRPDKEIKWLSYYVGTFLKD